VYQTRCRLTGQQYALKVCCKDNLRAKKIEQRIFKEIQVHSSLKHPQIAELLDSFEDEDNVYLLMEHFEGLELY
jgi:serine/threonine protein kinase